MIEVKSENGVVDLKVSGEAGLILADLMVIVSSVYDALVEELPEKKDAIKELIKGSINSDKVFEGEKDGEADD